MLLFAGIYNDLGSGSNVDLCIITKGKVDYKRNVELLMGKTYSRQKPVRYAPGTARKGPFFADALCPQFVTGLLMAPVRCKHVCMSMLLLHDAVSLL